MRLYTLLIILIGAVGINAQIKKDSKVETTIDSVKIKAMDVSTMSSDPYAVSMPQILSPSPESQVFQQFKGFDPDYSTGAVNVSIPLHTLTCGDFTLPLTLAYQSNGIKVDAPYFPLGYGWVLHPGLRISRTVLGKPDEYKYDKSLIPDANYTNKISNYYPILHYIYEGYGQSDIKYDIFTINLPSGNATFLLEKATSGSPWKAITVDSPYKIEAQPLSSNKFCSFKVTDEKGIEYYFGDVAFGDWKYTEYTEYNGDPIITGFYLRKIILPGTKEISIDWNRMSSSSSTVGFETINYYNDDPKGYGGSGKSGPESSTTNNASSPFTNTISRITAPNFELSCAYESGFLKRIEIKETSTWQILKDIKFNVNNSEKLLKEIVINEIEKYSFEYDPQRFVDGKAQDFWGYHNGFRNTILYPTFTPKTNRIPNFVLPGYQLLGAYRYPNEYAMKANILTKVIYPLGGYTEFEYEAHRYSSSSVGFVNKMQMGGGLRLKKITSYDTENADFLIREFKYGNGESGDGECSIEPNEETFVLEEIVNKKDGLEAECYAYRQLTILSNTTLGGYFQFNPYVWYPVVTEYSNEGKIKYVYWEGGDQVPVDRMLDFIKPSEIYVGLFLSWHEYIKDYNNYGVVDYNNIFKKERIPIKRKEIYKKDYNGFSLVSKENYYYRDYYHPRSYLPVIDITRVKRIVTTSGGSIEDQFDYLPSKFWLMSKKLWKTTNTEITDKGEVIQETDNEFTSDIYNLKSTTVTNSDGRKVKNEYLYANSDLSGLTSAQRGAVNEMLSRNFVTSPVCIKKTINNNPIVQKTIQYKNENHGGNSFIVPEKEYFKMGNGSDDVRIQHLNYTKYGKPSYIIKDDATKVVYLWSYKGQYPIAEIKNASYTDVITHISQETINTLADKGTPTEADFNIIHSLNSKIDNVLITTYTYKPFVGISSITDPLGIMSYFEYDKMGRLIETKDNEKNPLVSYTYNIPEFRAYWSNKVEPTYYLDDNLTFTIGTSGAYGNVSYYWYIDNVLKQSYGNAYRFIPNQVGHFTIKCVVKDQLTNHEDIILTKTIEIKYASLSAKLNISSLIYSQEEFDLKTQVTGGSGNLSYQWTIIDYNGRTIFNETTNENPLKASIGKEGSYNVICKIKDNTTLEAITRSSYIYPITLSARLKANGINYKNIYEKGERVNFSVDIDHGSGQYLYEWNAYNSKTNSYFTVGTDTVFPLTFTEDGYYEVECRIEDLVKDGVQYASAYFDVVAQYLKFGSASTTKNGNITTLSSSIYAKEETKIQVRVVYNVKNSTLMNLTLGTYNKTFYSNQNVVETITLKPGNNRVALEIVCNDSSASASIEIISVEKGTFESPKKIDLTL